MRCARSKFWRTKVALPTSSTRWPGSYYVESLTDEIERRAWEYIERIDERGGALAAVETGYIQSEIQEAAYEYQRQVERGERIIVGTNRFQSSEPEPTTEILTVDPSVRQRQCERLRALRARRDNERCAPTCSNGYEPAAANERENLLPLIVEAVEAYCTLGEISDAFRARVGRSARLRAHLSVATCMIVSSTIQAEDSSKSLSGGKSVAVQIRKLSSDEAAKVFPKRGQMDLSEYADALARAAARRRRRDRAGCTVEPGVEAAPRPGGQANRLFAQVGAR